VAALKPVSLTSVDQAGHLMGTTAAKLLLERIEGREQAVTYSVSPSLVTRRSTGAVRDRVVRERVVRERAVRDRVVRERVVRERVVRDRAVPETAVREKPQGKRARS
jgi:hypothetical protein